MSSAATQQQDDTCYIWDGTQDIAGHRTITHIRVSATVTEIPPLAFCHCVNLSKVELPVVGLTQLPRSCFFGCSSLKIIHLPESITKIARRAFQDSGLERIQIPPKVTYIAQSVFQGCQSLEQLDMTDTGITHIKNHAFQGCSSLKNVALPNTLREIGMHAFESSGLEKIRLPRNVSLKPTSFRKCSQLTEIWFPRSVGRIGKAFTDCRLVSAIYVIGHRAPALSAVEQKLVTELCRVPPHFGILDDHESLDCGIDLLNEIGIETETAFFCVTGNPIPKRNCDSTIRATCLLSFLRHHAHRMTENRSKQGNHA